jgi:predicted glutamine amidotransferase
MCRMIAAVGAFDLGLLKSTLSLMALNSNPAYEHEHRSRGDSLHHDCGWGAAFATPEGVVTRRSTRPCFEDPEFDALTCKDAKLAVLHARRNRDRSTIAVNNTHPFWAVWRGVEHAFCHNGEVRDRAQLSYDPRLVPRGTTDSELLFFHILTRMDNSAPLRSLEEALSGIRDFTALNCLLVSGDALLVYARMSAGNEYPRYYTLWRGRGDDVQIVSSEIVNGLDVCWEEVPGGTAIRIAV